MAMLRQFKLMINKATPEHPWPIPRIRVWPRNDEIRKYMKHPVGNIAFRATIADSVEWPFDQFTKRRLGSFDRPPSVYDHPPPFKDEPPLPFETAEPELEPDPPRPPPSPPGLFDDQQVMQFDDQPKSDSAESAEPSPKPDSSSQ
jgi:hypothetical protein